MYRTLSFYKYVRIEDPDALRDELYSTWSDLGVLGRIYVASEGINAQLSVPQANFDRFDASMKARPEFSDVPYKFAVEKGEDASFKKLIIKVKQKIVADGLDDDSFDVTKTGEYLTAEEFNQYIEDPDAVVVDMRNAYESEIGRFETAVTPDVDTFREELKVVPNLLADKKDKKIALYCTGGIRCEKASAWLRHNGFEDVKHLKGGIIDYKHQVEREGLTNRFQGKNFVFDERLGERIGHDIISHCHLCNNTKSDTHYHCKSEVCHILFIGCDECVQKMEGYCSLWCNLFDQLPQGIKKYYARILNRYFRPAQFKKNRLRSRNA
ncbi:hypothetical protein A2837_00645 [Candidatus Kaiserbacteria bacterium RIFCSPHIGHO2_01_FULL_46_22]|uniref:tRNA uridine(34) hydroxylase n=1 Tax=Candidatus Kaiserbacteria bacterium RIFCSPHIGHO2_01_FULL_46_22 TaxID=1798475 RepID=A0A1F6BXK6_9BACT|nr:MAG: hypothetical protein A2837_00645 [Candidatus Kaiserbacteria bacterium RIFCSPHIGHO2_01_FULL_46_22]